MNIAIVEDIQADRSLLTEKINHYMQQRELTYTLYSYERAEDFVAELNHLTFQIVFMDIYLEDMTGMEAARHLRRKDKNCKLIFITCSEEHLRQGYSVNACHYLLKPIEDTEFLEAMEHCQLLPQYDVPYLDVMVEGSSLHLNTGLIMYIMLERRTVQIHTTRKVLSVNLPFGRVTEPLLSDRRFLLCIQGVMVNMDYISDQEGSSFLLKNGARLPLNQRNRKQLLQTYRNYIFDNMGGEPWEI